ncbi:ABC transporter ATP-binding protein [Streptomyces boninensis]|uniref:ABC transporter ATP-binding protein n=1 Tax=Streptomyces boninensis TaxID=2039455 RepID=UPI003B2102CB
MFRRQRGGTAVRTQDHPLALSFEGVSRTYGGDRRALDDVTLAVRPGRFVAVLGRSGSGKSTLLQCAAGLDRPTSGVVRVGGTELAALNESALTRLRRERLGFVFQSLNLVESLTVAENVALPLILGGVVTDAARALPALEAVGLADRAGDMPADLSGGQRQRVAIARALLTEPELVFADEPTGALDPVSAGVVLGLLRKAVDADGRTVVMVTHDPVAAEWADEAVFLEDGRVVGRLDEPDAAAVRGAFGAIAGGGW